MSRPKLNPTTIKKICPTCNNEFDISFYLRNRRIFCSKKCSNNNVNVKEKNRQGVKKAFDEKYGMHPMKTETGKQNFKNALIIKYGVDWPSKIDGWYNKVKITNLKNHGIEHYNNIDKIKLTRASRDIDYNNDITDKTKLTKFRNHYDQLNKLYEINKIKMLCSFAEYKGYHFDNKYKFQCLKCDKIFESNIYKPHKVFCKYCHPEKIDNIETRLFKIVSDILPKETIIKQHDRTVLLRKELDIYIPTKNVAIELNGLYWHSEFGGKIKKTYHLYKTKSCAYHGIKLIHIFENEFNDKEEIVKSILKNILNDTTDVTRIYGRECEIKEVGIKEKNDFLNQNHLQGEDKSTVKLGLYKNNELVSVMTFRKTSRFDKQSDWELMRFCSKLNTIIVGGASKLFSYFINNYKFKQIVSYSDRRYFSGEIYNKLGFNFVGFTPPNYYYIINNYKDLKHRMSFQKHKLQKILKEYDCNLSEWENMKNNGYDRIWDCGNSKFIFVNSH